jgi:hypothetical protein
MTYHIDWSHRGQPPDDDMLDHIVSSIRKNRRENGTWQLRAFTILSDGDMLIFTAAAALDSIGFDDDISDGTIKDVIVQMYKVMYDYMKGQ